MSQLSLSDRAKKIRMLLLDVDGVLTNGQLYFDHQGNEIKAFNTLDGHGIKMLHKSGVQVGIITGRSSSAVSQRAKALGIEHVIMGQEEKLIGFAQIQKSMNLNNEEYAFMGDDLPDLPVMRRVGLALTVPNAHETVQQHAHWQSKKPGGHGAVREACDWLMKEQGSFDLLTHAYL